MLWEIANTSHRLIGSAHILSEDTALPNWVTASHVGIERFVFESGGEGSANEIGVDRTRSHLNSPEILEVYQSAKILLASIGINDPIDDLLPWCAAFQVVNRFVPILGVSQIYGVDYRLREIAEADGLKIDFLESSTRASELIDLACKKSDGGLNFFERTVEDIRSGEIRSELQRTLGAWLASDLMGLNAIRIENLLEFPSIFYPIITQRNREWATVAERFAADKVPTLFVVGCLHTVGSGSFIEQLEAIGFRLNFIA